MNLPSHPARPDAANAFVADLVARMAAEGLTMGVAESLTGGLLTSEFVRPPGASAVVLGGVVAYDARLKHRLLGVDEALLDEHGPVHPEVARQMADGVRSTVSVEGRPAEVGLATTGVAGPSPHAGRAPGTVYLGIAIRDSVEAVELNLEGTRDQVRARAVSEAVRLLAERLDRSGAGDDGDGDGE